MTAHPAHNRTWIEIDLGAFAHNIRQFRKAAGMIMPCVKANAYGHGAADCARAAVLAGADRIAVATSLEGGELRRAGIDVPIQMLGAILPEEIRPALENRLVFSLHDAGMAERINREAEALGVKAMVHLKIDTGMGRLGILPEDAVLAASAIQALPHLVLEGVFMHFADASDLEYSGEQLRRFAQARQALREAGIGELLCHAASSTAIFLVRDSLLDMTRPGAGIYGFMSPTGLAARSGLRPVLAWRARVAQVKEYPAGASLGYNRTFVAQRPTTIAVIPVGYADGYRRELSNKADVLIGGKRAPVAGMVSMDYIMADVTDLPGIAVGSVATLIGRDGGEEITAEELADLSGTIPYCIVTGIGNRPHRIVVPA